MRENPPADADLLEVLLGRTGSLRAPALRTGGTLLVGFSEDMYRVVFSPRRP